MQDVLLVVPTLADREAAADYIRAHHENGEYDTHGSSNLLKLPFDEWLRRCYMNPFADKCQAGHVPATRFVLKRLSDGKWLGTIQIRTEINDHLYWFGGHIGYAVRPDERRRGYATLMLRQALDYCRAVAIPRTLIICYADNPASERTILACGGVLENSCMEKNGQMLHRYWIDIA